MQPEDTPPSVASTIPYSESILPRSPLPMPVMVMMATSEPLLYRPMAPPTRKRQILGLMFSGAITIPLFALAPIPTPSPIKAIIINQPNGEASLKLFLFRKTDQRLKSCLNGPLTTAAHTMAIGIP